VTYAVRFITIQFYPKIGTERKGEKGRGDGFEENLRGGGKGRKTRKLQLFFLPLLLHSSTL